MAVIYALVDPRCNQIRYIGRAKDADKRKFTWHSCFKNKWQPKRVPHRMRLWIKDMKLANLFPEFMILEETTKEDMVERETLWLSFAAENGWDLLNRDVYLMHLRQTKFAPAKRPR